MSVFCPKCSKRTYDEYLCDFCGFEIRTKNHKDAERNLKLRGVHLGNPIAVVGVIGIVIIAISVGYMAISHHKQVSDGEKLMKAFVGTSDMDKLIVEQKRSMKNFKKQIDGILK